MSMVMTVVTAAGDWLSAFEDWLHTGDHMNLLYFCLAFALLLELSFRVIRRYFADRRAKIDAAENNQRVKTRARGAPIR